MTGRISGSRGKMSLKFLGMLIQMMVWEDMYRTNIKKEAPLNYPVKRWGIPKAAFISGPGFYELVFKSKLPIAEKLRDWVFSQVLPSIRKYWQYKLFHNPNNNMFRIENETDLHCKVVQYIRRFYPDAIIIAVLGEKYCHAPENHCCQLVFWWFS